MSDIFISYASEDRPRAQYLAQVLEGVGWSIFWDRTIPIGKTWRETIGRELDDARCVIVLWSKTSIESGWVQEEADDGKQRGVLVPVLIENVQPPLGFRSIQAADLVDWGATGPTQAFNQLKADIVRLIGPPQRQAQKPPVSPDTRGREQFIRAVEGILDQDELCSARGLPWDQGLAELSEDELRRAYEYLGDELHLTAAKINKMDFQQLLNVAKSSKIFRRG